jgi:hypothetical protein
MTNPNPQDGITPGARPPAPGADDAISPGAAPVPPPLPKKSYEQYDDEPALPSLAQPGTGEASGMGSLAQSARGTQLNQVRWTLIIIGIITIGFNVFMLATNRSNVENILQQKGIHQVPPDIERLLELDRLTAIAFVLLGGIFIVLGLAVKAQPVLCTTLGLVLYIAGNLISAAIDPMTIMQGFIVKIIIVVALFRAIGAARAYENEQRQAELDPAQ